MLEKPVLWMRQWIVSMCEDETTQDPYETSECEAEQADSTSWVVREGCLPDENEGRQIIPSEDKEELQDCGEIPRAQNF